MSKRRRGEYIIVTPTTQHEKKQRTFIGQHTIYNCRQVYTYINMHKCIMHPINYRLSTAGVIRNTDQNLLYTIIKSIVLQ